MALSYTLNDGLVRLVASARGFLDQRIDGPRQKFILEYSIAALPLLINQERESQMAPLTTAQMRICIKDSIELAKVAYKELR